MVKTTSPQLHPCGSLFSVHLVPCTSAQQWLQPVRFFVSQWVTRDPPVKTHALHMESLHYFFWAWNRKKNYDVGSYSCGKQSLLVAASSLGKGSNVEIIKTMSVDINWLIELDCGHASLEMLLCPAWTNMRLQYWQGLCRVVGLCYNYKLTTTNTSIITMSNVCGFDATDVYFFSRQWACFHHMPQTFPWTRGWLQSPEQSHRLTAQIRTPDWTIPGHF